MRKTNPICPAVPGGMGPARRGTRGKCAKRTQFFDCGLRIADSRQTYGGTPPAAYPPPCGRQMRKTKPISPERPGMGAGGRGREVPTRKRCKTNPILRLRIADWAQTSGRATNRAKRTQFRRSARAPESKTCKTKPISGRIERDKSRQNTRKTNCRGVVPAGTMMRVKNWGSSQPMSQRKGVVPWQTSPWNKRVPFLRRR